MKKEKLYYDIKDLLPVALIFGIAGVGIAYTTQIQGQVQDDFITNTAGCNSTSEATCGADYNVTVDSIEATSEVADKMPTLAVVVMAAILLGVLAKLLFFTR